MRFDVTFAQDLPPSFVTCIFPSSVPAQITFSLKGDSAIVKIVQWFSAPELSADKPPDSTWFCFNLSLVDKSGEIFVQVFPISFETCTNWLPANKRSGLWGLVVIGVFQLNRSFGSPLMAYGFTTLSCFSLVSKRQIASAPCISE